MKPKPREMLWGGRWEGVSCLGTHVRIKDFKIKKKKIKKKTKNKMWCWRRLLRVPVNLERNQPWILIGRTDAKAEAPILCPHDAKRQLIRKDPDAGKDWGKEEKGTIEDEMAGWHHQLDEHGFGWTLGVGDGQGGLAYCSSWGRKESDMTERLNWTETFF